MDEARLDELIRKLHQLPLEEPETTDCPPFAQLWAYESSGQPLGSAEQHVGQCPRCRRLMGIMRGELAVADVETRPTRPFRFLHRAGVVLAAAACIAILVLIGWPRGDGTTGPPDRSSLPVIEAMILPFANAAFGHAHGPVRGLGGDEASPATTAQGDLDGFLRQSTVQEAQSLHRGVRRSVHRAWIEGLITSDGQGYLALTAKGQAAAPKQRQSLERWIDQENRARDKVVEAIQGYEPALKDVQADKIRRALDRYLAKQVFGGD